jgi:serine/threonine protein kinase
VDFDEDGIDLLEKMLKFHPDDRITAEEGLKHPFLKDFHGQMPEPVTESVFESRSEMATEDSQHFTFFRDFFSVFDGCFPGQTRN